MDEILEMFFKDKSPQDISNILINLNRHNLNRKEHIKKYNKLRKLHGEIIDSMLDYIEKGKYLPDKYHILIKPDITRETKGLKYNLNPNDEDDITILSELFLYKTHSKVPSLTDIYLEKKIFRNKDKIKMLNAMKNSYVGLFKVIKVDSEEGYVYYQDVFTNKKFKVIDIAMSSTLKVDKKMPIHIYNRVITIDNISFATGMHCIFGWSNKYIKEFIKKHKYNNCSDFSRCLLLYDISKKDNKLKVNHNHTYGYNR